MVVVVVWLVGDLKVLKTTTLIASEAADLVAAAVFCSGSGGSFCAYTPALVAAAVVEFEDLFHLYLH